MRIASPLRAARALLACALFACAAPAGSSATDSPVVVELFTSQGCWSCPPADEILGRLAERDDIVALSLHVDYWNYLGWRDTFSQKAFTHRQIGYRDSFGRRSIYTPQMVVQGVDQAVGSNEGEVEAAIARARATEDAARIEIVERDGALKGRIAPLNGGTGGAKAALFIATYAKERVVEIARGENGGKTLTYRNVVDEMRKLDDWDGGEAEFDLPIPGPGEGIALWAQGGRTGPILAAARFER